MSVAVGDTTWLDDLWWPIRDAEGEIVRWVPPSDPQWGTSWIAPDTAMLDLSPSVKVGEPMITSPRVQYNTKGSKREVIFDVHDKIAGVLKATGDVDVHYDYEEVPTKPSWEEMFPHEVDKDDLESSIWMRDPSIGPGDRVTINLLEGKFICDVCGKNKPQDELEVAVLHRQSENAGLWSDYTDYAFRLECLECLPQGAQTTGYNPNSSGGHSGGTTDTTSTSWGATSTQWKLACPDGHFQLMELGPKKGGKKGGLILSSWRGKYGGRVATNADYCMFLSEDWDIYWQPPVKMYPGTDGTVMPHLLRPDGLELPPCAIIKWYDYGPPPPVGVDYVELAASLIREGKQIQTGCFGGHGRTGTFAAMVALALGKVRTGQGAINYVRKNYCDEAIESVSQENAIKTYAEKLYGRPRFVGQSRRVREQELARLAANGDTVGVAETSDGLLEGTY